MIVEADDVGVVEVGQGFHFGFEDFPAALFGGLIDGHHFGDVLAMELVVRDAIDFGESTFAD